jgi:hypothetical protein
MCGSLIRQQSYRLLVKKLMYGHISRPKFDFSLEWIYGVDFLRKKLLSGLMIFYRDGDGAGRNSGSSIRPAKMIQLEPFSDPQKSLGFTDKKLHS